MTSRLRTDSIGGALRALTRLKNRNLLAAVCVRSLGGILCLMSVVAGAAEPLRRAHAHNDYEHSRPLLDALENGFCSVEADIHLVDGDLLVAHDLVDAKPERTLQKLYLDPLRARVRANGGSVHAPGDGFTLLIDIKTSAADTYPVLRKVLEEYREMLTRFTGRTSTVGAVTAILSGNRPTQTVQSETERLCAIDGRLNDLESPPPRTLVPLISESWSAAFRWDGQGEFPQAERDKLTSLVQRTHAQNRRLRFWATPDRPAAWQVLLEAGVDLINTDRLNELRAFLSSQTANPPRER